MAGLVTGDSIVNPDKMFENAGIKLIIGRAEHVDAERMKVILGDGGEIPYDKLLLATGSSPIIPPIEGNDLEGVFVMRSLRDAEKIRRFLEETQAKKLVFVGAGFISLEVATLLLTSDSSLKVTLVELLDHPLPLMLDAEIAAKVKDYLEEKGFDLRMGQKVSRILGRNGRVAGVELATGEKIDADMVFLNVGARPSLELAKEIGLEIGKFGIKVDRTSWPQGMPLRIIILLPRGRSTCSSAVRRSSRVALRLSGLPVMGSNSPGCWATPRSSSLTGVSGQPA